MQDMGQQKTGRSLAVEHLLHLDKDMLATWLPVTRMIFAGETVEEGKLGTVGPLTKDLSRFRPITLLEPIYKCCMGTVAKRTAVLLHKFDNHNSHADS